MLEDEFGLEQILLTHLLRELKSRILSSRLPVNLFPSTLISPGEPSTISIRIWNLQKHCLTEKRTYAGSVVLQRYP